MREASAPDLPESISNKPIELAGSEPGDVEAHDPVDDWDRLGLNRDFQHSVLEWIGPAAFDRAHGAVPGVDHDAGTRWGSNGDQRISLHLNVGAEVGLLYVYDPTWDEYAVLGNDVPRAAVEEALYRSAQLAEHPSVEGFVALLPNVPTARRSPEPEL